MLGNQRSLSFHCREGGAGPSTESTQNANTDNRGAQDTTVIPGEMLTAMPDFSEQN